MGLLQNTSQDSGWNLADEINTDWSSGALFDDLPSSAKALRGDEVIQSGRELNTSAEGSFVPGSAIAPIETPKSRAHADSTLRESQAQLSGNPLDNFQVAAKAEAEEEPRAYSTGQAISEGYRMISDIKRMQAGRTGRNAREVAREKALDNQAIGAVYTAMQQHLESKGYDPRLVDMLGTKQGGGFRTAEDIDRLFKIKNEGVEYQGENGPVQVVPDADWDLVFEADRISRAQALKSQKAATDPQARLNQRAEWTSKQADLFSKRPEEINSEEYRQWARGIREYGRLIDSTKTPEERTQDYGDVDQVAFSSGFGWSKNQENPTVNYLGQPLADTATEDKTTHGQKFAQLVQDGSIPSVSGKWADGGFEGNYDQLRDWFESRGMVTPSRFTVGLKADNKVVPAVVYKTKDGTFNTSPLFDLASPKASGSEPGKVATKYSEAARREAADEAIAQAKNRKSVLESEIADLSIRSENVRPFMEGNLTMGMRRSARSMDDEARKLLNKKSLLEAELNSLKEKFPNL